ncbi:IPT/TIG domain-containing protein [Marinilabilia sp.]|uniref:IPT/TIG domain-containing protein n=1 Tax=Marinilabilia sp. TaxID=2021252 RepID=UPI0025BEE6B9|nr:IPT/TIG domain-containing protein [Marinilabilia sp.]
MKNSKVLKALFRSLFVIMIFGGCHKEKIEARFYPRVRTHNVSNITSDGATFWGEIIAAGNSPALEYGFAWSTHDTPSPKISEHIIVEEVLSSGKFSCRIDFSLIRSEKYYVRSFVKTDELTVFGNAVSFVSDGSGHPNIHEVLPPTGFWGDTISFVGEGFSSIENSIFFGELKAEVIMNSDSLIKAIVPSSPNEESVDITHQVDVNSAVWPGYFQYRVPELRDFAPREALFGDTVTIRGNNFHPNSGFTKAFFNDIESDIIFLSDSVVKTIVPENLKSSANTLTILSDSFRVKSAEHFYLIPLQFSGFSPDTFTVFEDDLLLTIYGTGFSSLSDKNTVLFEEHELEVDQAWPDSLHVIIPLDIFPNPDYAFDLKGGVKVKVADQSMVLQDSVHFINEGIFSWNRRKEFPGEGRVDALSFSFNGKGYVGTGLNYEDAANEKYFSDFWEYDPVSDNWSRIDDLPGDPRAGAAMMKINNTVYVGLGSSNYNDESSYMNDWYRFNEDGSWTQLNDFPGAGRHGSFSMMNYLGGGKVAPNDQGQRDYRDLWTYNPAADLWTSQAEIPYSIVEDDGLVLNNTGYIFSENKIFEFENGRWDYYSVSGVSQGYSGFTLRDRICRAFSLGEGNNLSGSQIILAADMSILEASEIHFPWSARTHVTIFTIGDSAYFVGGTTYDNSTVFLTDFYELSIDK